MSREQEPSEEGLAERSHAVPETNGHLNGNGNGANRSLAHLWEGDVHFVMRSFEATMVLPAEEPVDAEATVISPEDPAR